MATENIDLVDLNIESTDSLDIEGHEFDLESGEKAEVILGENDGTSDSEILDIFISMYGEETIKDN